MKKKALLILAVALVAVGALTSPASATYVEKIKICHATGSESNPYVEIKVAVEGLNGHGDHGDDIIPAPEGGCPQPTPPTTVPCPPFHQPGDGGCQPIPCYNNLQIRIPGCDYGPPLTTPTPPVTVVDPPVVTSNVTPEVAPAVQVLDAAVEDSVDAVPELAFTGSNQTTRLIIAGCWLLALGVVCLFVAGGNGRRFRH